MTHIFDKNGHISIAYITELQLAAIDQEQRHRNEVRKVASLETHAARAVYIEGEGGVRDSRGKEAADRLRRDVWQLLKSEGRHVEPEQAELLP